MFYLPSSASVAYNVAMQHCVRGPVVLHPFYITKPSSFSLLYSFTADTIHELSVCWTNCRHSMRFSDMYRGSACVLSEL